MPITKGKAAAWLVRGGLFTGASAVSPVAGVAAGVGLAAEGGARAFNKAASNPTNPASRALFTTLIGGSAVAGAVSEISDPDGPYGDIAENVTGERNFVRYMAGISAKNALSTRQPQVNQGPLEYFNGGTVNPQALDARRRGRPQAPDGSMVWGMYNMRRG